MNFKILFCEENVVDTYRQGILGQDEVSRV